MTQACIFCHNLDIVKLLIHHGAHINDKDYVSLLILIQKESRSDLFV